MMPQDRPLDKRQVDQLAWQAFIDQQDADWKSYVRRLLEDIDRRYGPAPDPQPEDRN